MPIPHLWRAQKRIHKGGSFDWALKARGNFYRRRCRETWCGWQSIHRGLEVTKRLWLEDLVTHTYLSNQLKQRYPHAWREKKSKLRVRVFLHILFKTPDKEFGLNLSALGRPRGSGWRGKWEGGLGWGTHVNPWLFHFNVWQNSLQIKKLKKIFFLKRRSNRKQQVILGTVSLNV